MTTRLCVVSQAVMGSRMVCGNWFVVRRDNGKDMVLNTRLCNVFGRGKGWVDRAR